MTKTERNEAIYNCHKKGITQTTIGEIFSLAQSTVNLIISSFKKGVTLEKEEARGLKSRLTDAEKKKLKTLLLKSPKDYDFFTWDKWSIKSLIKQEFGVDYHENYIWRIMKCINYTSQKPQVKDYRKDAEKVRIFKEETAESIKKKPKRKIGG